MLHEEFWRVLCGSSPETPIPDCVCQRGAAFRAGGRWSRRARFPPRGLADVAARQYISGRSMPARIRVGNARQWVTVHRGKFAVNPQNDKGCRVFARIFADSPKNFLPQRHRGTEEPKLSKSSFLVFAFSVTLCLCVSVVKQPSSAASAESAHGSYWLATLAHLARLSRNGYEPCRQLNVCRVGGENCLCP